MIGVLINFVAYCCIGLPCGITLMFLVFHEITGKRIENCYISVQIQQICQCLIAVFGERINFMIRVGRGSSCSNKA